MNKFNYIISSKLGITIFAESWQRMLPGIKPSSRDSKSLILSDEHINGEPHWKCRICREYTSKK